VIKLDIVNAVVATTNISRTKAEQAVETVFESLRQALGRGQRIELRRFGVFSVKPRKTGIGRNPRTGEEVNIPPGKPSASNPAKSFRALKKEKRRDSRASSSSQIIPAIEVLHLSKLARTRANVLYWCVSIPLVAPATS
jgi:DNA-binding protein HU-beta